MSPRPKRSALPTGCINRDLLLRSLLRDVSRITIDGAESTSLSYPEFVRYFQDAGTLSKHHLIIGASLAYSWMPTILDFRHSDLDGGVRILEKARAGADLDAVELLLMASIVNNSVVGASKLLHFVAPQRFAVWDSRVATYLGSATEGGAFGVERYVGFNECCRALATMPRAGDVAAAMTSRLGVLMQPMRAIELVMFFGGLEGYSYAA